MVYCNTPVVLRTIIQKLILLFDNTAYSHMPISDGARLFTALLRSIVQRGADDDGQVGVVGALLW